MALKSVKYDAVEIYPECPTSIRERIVAGILLTAAGKSLEPIDVLQAEASNLSTLSNDAIRVILIHKNIVNFALAGNTRRPLTYIAQVRFSIVSK